MKKLKDQHKKKKLRKRIIKLINNFTKIKILLENFLLNLVVK